MKNEITEIEIRNFTLEYDGVYRITMSNGKKRYACLTLDVILKMLEIEGLTINEVSSLLKSWKPIVFNKVSLQAYIIEKENGGSSLLISELAESWKRKKRILMVDFSIKN